MYVAKGRQFLNLIYLIYMTEQQNNDNGGVPPEELSPLEEPSDETGKKKPINVWQIAAIGFFGLFLFSLFFNRFEVSITPKGSSRSGSAQVSAPIAGTQQDSSDEELTNAVLPQEGVVLPIKWGDFGKQLVDTGVIDAEKFEQLYSQRGGLGEEEKQLLYGTNNGNLKMDAENSGFLLNLFWAFGLGNKNPILEEGPMVQYGGDASRFASTGGWTLAKGNAMDHYSKHAFVTLTPDQQQLVERVSQGIFRPCCGNPTYFPDCNHGMAMLGLLELMASQGVGEEEMYKVALKVNSYWFPSTYLTIAKYFAEKGTSWDKVDPKEVLGANFSSAQGYRQILQQVQPVQQQGGGGCGV